MDSQAGYAESSMDQDDMPFPCKGCGEILEEGKAFELAGSRWHIDCFRCNTCRTLLDSDAHLLLLGDGSLICNNCTYSCSSCGNKIEDLAILTGDQAFCANCFKCRNCKKRIENLRYARTSQGIFCMDCHESLMQRRRKRNNRTALQTKRPNPGGMKLDKSLPSLPQGNKPESALQWETEKQSAKSLSDASPVHSGDHYPPSRGRAEGSPARQLDAQDNLILPSSTYRSNRQSILSDRSDVDGGDEFLIPVALDPSAEEHQPNHISDLDSSNEIDDAHLHDHLRTGAPPLRLSTDRHETSSENSSPHIAFQEKGRQPEDIDPSRWRQDVPASESVIIVPERSRQRDVSNPRNASNKVDSRETFRLQDAPKGKKLASARSSKSDITPVAKESATASILNSLDNSNQLVTHGKDVSKIVPAASFKPPASETPGTLSFQPPNELRQFHEDDSTDFKRFYTPAPTTQYPPKRADSLEDKSFQTQRKEVSSSVAKQISDQADGDSDKGTSASSTGLGKHMEQRTNLPRLKTTDDHASSPQSHGSPSGENLQDDATEPRIQSTTERHQHDRNASAGTLQSDSQRPSDSGSLPSLLRYNGGNDFSIDEDMARIMGMDEGPNAAQNPESFLRRVSNSVRHGRSFSDRGSRLSKEAKWPKSSPNGTTFGQVISSPSTSSPDPSEEASWLKSELRRERQRVIERDQKLTELETALNAVAEVKQVNTELREKRSTMVILDAKKEIVLRELTVLTEHLEAERDGSAPLDLGKFTSNVIRKLVESLQQLKDSFAPEIEELTQKRNDIREELSNLSCMKDKSFQEFAQLSSKNAQLAELNNQLVHQIQELYKANSGSSEASRPSNGLVIHSHNKEKSTVSAEAVKASAHDLSSLPGPTVQHEEADSATVVPGPQVVSIRKGQPKKFNWKKGSQNVAKGVTKGLKGAFSYNESKENTAYGPSTALLDTPSNLPRSQTQDLNRQGFGFFGNQKKQAAWKMQQSGSSPALVEAAISTAATAGSLFGTELEQRLEQEKCIIPAIVTRCIQEVELRGMDQEGIYRKSGASSAIQAIRDGFERSPLDYDISDPDLDIHAVTSALKQYLRKLPTPLITHDVYNQIIDTNEITLHSARVEALRCGLHSLPRVHRDVLEFLVFHLKRVVDHEKENLMSSMNVAVVFAPTILRPESLTREMTDVQKKNEALKFLIDYCQETFMEM